MYELVTEERNIDEGSHNSEGRQIIEGGRIV
jgi:hypothetical protein